MYDVKSIEEVDQFITENPMSFLYVSQPQCGVCKALLPKVEEMLERFPKVKSAYVNTEAIPDVAAKLQIFTVPVILFYVDGREYIRKARFVSMDELEQEIDKIYRLVTE